MLGSSPRSNRTVSTVVALVLASCQASRTIVASDGPGSTTPPRAEEETYQWERFELSVELRDIVCLAPQHRVRILAHVANCHLAALLTFTVRGIVLNALSYETLFSTGFHGLKHTL